MTFLCVERRDAHWIIIMSMLGVATPQVELKEVQSGLAASGHFRAEVEENGNALHKQQIDADEGNS